MAGRGPFGRLVQALGRLFRPAPTPPPAAPRSVAIERPDTPLARPARVVLDGVMIHPSLLPLPARVPLNRHEHRPDAFMLAPYEYQGMFDLEDERGYEPETRYTAWLSYEERPTNLTLARDFIRSIGEVISGQAIGSETLNGRILAVGLAHARYQ